MNIGSWVRLLFITPHAVNPSFPSKGSYPRHWERLTKVKWHFLSSRGFSMKGENTRGGKFDRIQHSSQVVCLQPEWKIAVQRLSSSREGGSFLRERVGTCNCVGPVAVLGLFWTQSRAGHVKGVNSLPAEGFQHKAKLVRLSFQGSLQTDRKYSMNEN